MKLFTLQQLFLILTLTILSSNAERRIFVGDDTGNIQILSAKSGNNSVSLTTFQAHNCSEEYCSATINYILDLQQDDLIATCSNDGAISIWKSLPDSPYISIQRQLSGHKASVDALQMYNSRAFLSSAEDGTVKLWDIETGDCLSTLNVTTAGHLLYGLVALPDGRIITSDSDLSNPSRITSTIKIWNLEDSTSQLVATLPTMIMKFEVVGYGTYLAVATRKNCNTCNTTANADDDRGSIYLYFLNDPSEFFVLGDTGLPNEQDLSDYPGYFHTDTVNNLKSINDHMFASGSRDKTVKVWDFGVFSDENAPVAPLTFTCLGKVNGLDYDEAAKLLISGSYDGSINSYSMEQEEEDHLHHKHEHHEHYQYGTLLESYNSGQGVLFVMVGDFSGNDDKI